MGHKFVDNPAILAYLRLSSQGQRWWNSSTPRPRRYETPSRRYRVNFLNFFGGDFWSFQYSHDGPCEFTIGTHCHPSIVQICQSHLPIISIGSDHFGFYHGGASTVRMFLYHGLKAVEVAPPAGCREQPSLPWDIFLLPNPRRNRNLYYIQFMVDTEILKKFMEYICKVLYDVFKKVFFFF